ncbi:MAG: aldo/keto reductase [Planctomycetes bacterium]|nr:aldo/keto reductase [Planctomycetota bacterium]
MAGQAGQAGQDGRVPGARDVGGVRVPALLYGTAWKEEETRRLVRLALEAGFRGIDTANQRKHYHEAAVGQALADAFADGRVRRDELFVQTKFTHVGGQDHRLPYDPTAPVPAQVRASCASSLEHLGLDVLDAYVLHGPSARVGLAEADLAAWTTMEALQREGRVRLLGVSNVTRAQLEALCAHAAAPPAFVQNRCYARTGWDRAVRDLCRERGMIYQAFSLLTANRRELEGPVVRDVAARARLTPAQVVFLFAVQVGMLPLTGTTSPVHMREDLAALDHAALDPEDVRRLERVSG